MSIQLLNSSLTFYIGLTVLLQLISISSCQSSNSSDDCTTPSGQRGQCINIRQCPAIHSFIAYIPTPIPPEVKETVAALRCGFEGRDPKVCCITRNIKPQPAYEPESYQDPPAVEGHPNLELLPKSCGVVYEVRVAGGNKPKIFEFPWMAHLLYNTSKGWEYHCGGTVLNERYILTSANCILARKNYVLAKARVGEHDITQKFDCSDENMTLCTPPYQDIDIEEMIPHPDYLGTGSSGPNSFHNDIGLLKLASPIDLSQVNIVPICLPHLKTHREKQLNDIELWITGWGQTEDGTASQYHISEKIPYVPNEQCADAYKKHVTKPISFRQLCAGGVNGGDACLGDSGGPLQAMEHFNEQQRYVQYGIISYGPNPCGQDGIPGVYTRVSYYVKWILDTMRP